MNIFRACCSLRLLQLGPVPCCLFQRSRPPADILSRRQPRHLRASHHSIGNHHFLSGSRPRYGFLHPRRQFSSFILTSSFSTVSIMMASQLSVLPPFPVPIRTLDGSAPLLTSYAPPARWPSVRKTLGNLLEPGTVSVGGHRGAGENLLGGEATSGTMLYRENTMGSFRRAVALGASFVEFDVQVTRDGVPVIFHDNHIEWGSADSYQSRQISELTHAEFKSLCSNKQTSVVRRTRNASLAWDENRREWQCMHEEEMPTLQQMLEELPEHIAFDLEVKMTTPNTSVTSGEEISRMLQPIMKTVQQHAGNRRIVFSSFDPDVCVALNRMQQEHTVMLLTACEQEHADARRRDVDAAVSVAEACNLTGVIVDTARLFDNPMLVPFVKDRGLLLGSYGLRNNDPEWVNQQVLSGVDIVIADDVASALSGVALSTPVSVIEG